MKIFALNLCLAFQTKKDFEHYTFSLISFNELMGHFFKGPSLQNQQFYVKAESGEEFLNQVFELQKNDIWREMRVNVNFVFDHQSQLDKFVSELKDKFRHKAAAGGLGVNEKGEYLSIFNRGRWTLPKGGVEWREEIADAAIRETEEETGISNVSIEEKLLETYHTFSRGRKWVLKTTHWFRMKGSVDSPLQPQAEENIEMVKWMSKAEWQVDDLPTYPLTRYLFEYEFSRSFSEKSA